LRRLGIGDLHTTEWGPRAQPMPSARQADIAPCLPQWLALWHPQWDDHSASAPVQNQLGQWISYAARCFRLASIRVAKPGKPCRDPIQQRPAKWPWIVSRARLSVRFQWEVERNVSALCCFSTRLRPWLGAGSTPSACVTLASTSVKLLDYFKSLQGLGPLGLFQGAIWGSQKKIRAVKCNLNCRICQKSTGQFQVDHDLVLYKLQTKLCKQHEHNNSHWKFIVDKTVFFWLSWF